MRALVLLAVPLALLAACSPSDDGPVPDEFQERFVQTCVDSSAEEDAEVMAMGCRCAIEGLAEGHTYGEVKDLQAMLRRGEELPDDVDRLFAECSREAAGG